MHRNHRHRDSLRYPLSLGKVTQTAEAFWALPKPRGSQWWVSSASVRGVNLARLVHHEWTQFCLNEFINQSMSAVVKHTYSGGLCRSYYVDSGTFGNTRMLSKPEMVSLSCLFLLCQFFSCVTYYM